MARWCCNYCRRDGAGVVIGDAITSGSSTGNVANGVATCADNNTIEGIFIDAGPQSNWAQITPPGGVGKTVKFTLRIGNQTTFKVDVGCNGSPHHFAKSDYSESPEVANYPALLQCDGTSISTLPAQTPSLTGVCRDLGLSVLALDRNNT